MRRVARHLPMPVDPINQDRSEHVREDLHAHASEHECRRLNRARTTTLLPRPSAVRGIYFNHWPPGDGSLRDAPDERTDFRPVTRLVRAHHDSCIGFSRVPTDAKLGVLVHSPGFRTWAHPGHGTQSVRRPNRSAACRGVVVHLPSPSEWATNWATHRAENHSNHGTSDDRCDPSHQAGNRGTGGKREKPRRELFIPRSWVRVPDGPSVFDLNVWFLRDSQAGVTADARR